jgi:hypothetical protein
VILYGRDLERAIRSYRDVAGREFKFQQAPGTTRSLQVTGSAPAGWLVPGLTLAAFTDQLNAVGLAPFLPVVAVELGVGVALLGQVTAAMMLLALVAAVRPGGRPSRRVLDRSGSCPR